MSETVTATAYLVVQGRDRRSWGDDKRVRSAAVTKARRAKPDSLGEDEIVVKVRIELPRQAFEPLEPEALVVVPEELVQHVVEVEAQADGRPPYFDPALESD